MMAWIQKESYGNPCSWTSLRESGISQLMAGQNQQVAGTTEEALRAACVPYSSSMARSLTAAEAAEQVRSMVAYVRWAKGDAKKKMAQAGVSWSEGSKDFWKMVKFVHVAPARIVPWLTLAKQQLGRAPRSWAEIVPYAGAANIPAHWVANADWVGNFGGGISTGVLAAAVVAGAGVLYYLYARR
jgi:hypothetical protein